ncbi:MAG: bifunctional alpha,alpha-trehalose-phosphate synthase (UDP-forming)/trehalose-phosphatase [Bacteroidia bacterium]|nr:MAG: bifunctional alpha,alpha-trehalose-phosphate synthase (UDP-forming)/trehalose-phosphatase [Bacteroidia bacterium]
MRKRRLVILSNRLPFTVRERAGDLRFTASVGGLATGLSAFLRSLETADSMVSDYLWVGWPGSTVSDGMKARVRREAAERFKSSPIFLSSEEMDLFYHGFCNETLWPLFHYFPSITTYRESHWKQYQEVNKVFAERVAEILKPDDIVWVHDYQLMLVPRLLRHYAPQNPIGFFLHIPFPSFEIFRLIPQEWRREILTGLMGADLVGFHTYEYTQNFLRCVLRILGTGHTMGSIILHDRLVKAETFPMGIDVAHFSEAAKSPEVQREREAIRKSLKADKVILSVDRLDYTKGILNRLEAYEFLLENFKELRRKVVLVMIVVPSRVAVKQYERMKKQIEETVGRINGKFGSVRWTPIIYQYKALPFHPLVAFYTVSDVALVTPLRDGMNLVAKEYIASRNDETGVLILSEMAGAAKELGEAVIINPNYREEVAGAMRTALEMPPEEQKRRNRIMRDRIRRYDVVRWAQDFVSQVLSVRDVQKSFYSKLLTEQMKEEMAERYRRSRSRGIYLDYDGTLSPFTLHPEDAAPSENVLGVLKNLAKDPKNNVTIISGRKREVLGQWFRSMPIRLVAEHGVWVREPQDDWKMTKPINNSWKGAIMPIFELYADRLPGSFVEEKEFSVVWHYRAADPEHSESLAAELMDTLMGFTANIDAQVMRGNKIIEVRPLGITKGTIGEELIQRANDEFVLFIGDDWTDEDLFKVLPSTAYSVKVGMARTHARYMVQGVQDVLALLAFLSTERGGKNARRVRAGRLPGKGSVMRKKME